MHGKFLVVFHVASYVVHDSHLTVTDGEGSGVEDPFNPIDDRRHFFKSD